MGDWGLDIPLVGPPNANVDEVHLDQSAAAIIDLIPVIVEGKIHLIKRAGLEVFADLSVSDNEPVNGLYWYDRGRSVIAVYGNKVIEIIDSLGNARSLLGSTDLLPNRLATFAEFDEGVIIANGGPMVEANVVSVNTATIADAQAPTTVSHVVSLDKYILANDLGTGNLQFSAINDPTNWVALDVFAAESRYDDVVAIAEAYREIIALGRESVEFFINDGQTPFSRIQGSTQPFGTVAPYSLAEVDGAWMWLDHKKRIVTMQDRKVVPMETTYDRLLQRMDSVEDAVGYSTFIDNKPVYVLNFPTGGITLAYALKSKTWHQWGYWDLGHGRYQRFRGLSYCYASSWNLHLFGDHSTGKVYKAKPDVFTDNGNPIRSLLRTGHVSHGTYGMKRSGAIRLKCKRGAGNNTVADPQVSMRRRLDNKANWTQERMKSLGRVGQHEQFIDWRGNGRYKTCQYEFVHADDSAFEVMGAQEQVTLLTR